MGLDEKLGVLTPYRDVTKVEKGELWKTIVQMLRRKQLPVGAADRPKDDLRTQRKLRQTHWHIGVDLTYDGLVQLTLMRPFKYDGFVGQKADRVMLSVTDDDEAFWLGVHRAIRQV
jgi:hypothetical protein